MIAFQEFPKIPRYRREVIITEKIDGTNACVAWVPMTDEIRGDQNIIAVRNIKDQHGTDRGEYALVAQSRSKFITPARVKPKNDNHGFAAWVDENVDELTKLGPGYHYGEWWAMGIQRGYIQQRKRFSLFNVSRWGEGKQERPACCDVVPLLGMHTPDKIDTVLDVLRNSGSVAAPGFLHPEGIVIWHSQSKQYYKILLDSDDTPKSQMQNRGGAQSAQASGESAVAGG
jgi:hypothetical protein